MHAIIDFFLHIDVHLASVIQQYGAFTYIILFLIIFCETGLVIMPFLPGDSLLFAAGAFAARGSLHLVFLLLLLSVAAIAGDTVNYIIGREIGGRVYQRDFRFIKRKHLDNAKAFYERHGGKAIILARYIPVIRTFAPFVAGVGKMEYRSFISYNVIGGVAWILLFTCAGYLFGNIPFVQKNFEYVILAIIAVSLLPMVFEWVKGKIATKGV